MGGTVFPPYYLTWGQTTVEVMKIMAISFKRSHAHTATLSAPDPAGGHRQPTPLPETPGHSWTSLGQSLVGSLLLSPGSWCTQGSVCALQESYPVLCKFWQLHGGANGDLLQGGLCHNQVCCTQSPRPCSSPLLTCTSSVQFSSVSVVSNSSQLHGSQHARPPCPSQTLRVFSNSSPLSQWCHPTISFSVVPFSSCPQSLPASGTFQMRQFFTSGTQSIGASASTSVLLMNTQGWSLGWTG